MSKPNAEALDGLYDALPKLECKGHCWSSCGPIRMSPLEQERVAAAGVLIPPGYILEFADGRQGGTMCPALDSEEKTCAVYEARPMICRLWGLMPALRCPWGCVPEGGHLDDVEARKLLEKSLYYGGTPNALPPAMIDLHYSRRDVQRELRRRLKPSAPQKYAAIEQVDVSKVVAVAEG